MKGRGKGVFKDLEAGRDLAYSENAQLVWMAKPKARMQLGYEGRDR